MPAEAPTAPFTEEKIENIAARASEFDDVLLIGSFLTMQSLVEGVARANEDWQQLNALTAGRVTFIEMVERGWVPRESFVRALNETFPEGGDA